jgi:hypothetical protein
VEGGAQARAHAGVTARGRPPGPRTTTERGEIDGPPEIITRHHLFVVAWAVCDGWPGCVTAVYYQLYKLAANYCTIGAMRQSI